MAVGRVFDIFASIVTLGVCFVVVSSPNTAKIISAWGEAFSGSMRAAMGR